MKEAEIGGLSIDYEDAGSGEPVVFVHGAFIAETFRPLAVEPHLSRFRRITYARRGYAGSSHGHGLTSISQQAADCLALMSSLGVGRAHVVGHSFGGCIALQLALAAPQAVHSLALLEPALMVGTSAQAYRESLLLGARRYQEAGAPVVVAEFLEARWPGYRTALDRALPGAVDQAVEDAPTWFENEMPALLAWRFGEAEANRVGAPVLAVLGGGSSVLSPRFEEVQEALLAWLPAAEGLVLPGVTHFMQLEDPRGTAGVLADFWARHPMPAHSPAS